MTVRQYCDDCQLTHKEPYSVSRQHGVCQYCGKHRWCQWYEPQFDDMFPKTAIVLQVLMGVAVIGGVAWWCFAK